MRVCSLNGGTRRTRTVRAASRFQHWVSDMMPPRIDRREQALCWLFTHFLWAAVPTVPLMVLPVADARVASAIITVALPAALRAERARIGKRNVL